MSLMTPADTVRVRWKRSGEGGKGHERTLEERRDDVNHAWSTCDKS